METRSSEGKRVQFFTFRVLKLKDGRVFEDVESVQIAYGKYKGGQMLPENFCLDRSDEEIKNTLLDFVFAINSTLPTQTKKRRRK